MTEVLLRDDGTSAERDGLITDEEAAVIAQGYMESGCKGINAVAQRRWTGEDTGEATAEDILYELARETDRIDSYEFPGQTERELFALVRWVCDRANVIALDERLVVLANSLGTGVKITIF